MTATACEATGQSLHREYSPTGRQVGNGKHFGLAISGYFDSALAEALLLVIGDSLGPIRQVECSRLPLAGQLFEAVSKGSFDLVIVFISPHWRETSSTLGDAQRDRDLLRKLRSRSSAPLIVIHNGSAGHKEESLRELGVDLVLPMPFEIATLLQFLSTRFKLASHDSQSDPVQEKRDPVDPCKALLDAATKDIFRKNAFRITGLPVDATARDIAKHSDKLKMLAELGQNSHAQSGYFSIKPAPSLDDIREATQKLKDPEKRMVDEFFWFWPEEFGKSQSDPAIQAVTNGDPNTAMKIWSARENGDVPSIVAKHNLAVAYHLRAVDWENYSVKNEVDSERRQKITHYWQEAFNRWQWLATNDWLWEIVSTRIRELKEQNLRTGFARRMRGTLTQALCKINAELAVAFVGAGKTELGRRHIQFMRETGAELIDVEKIAEIILTPVRKRLNEQVRQAKERADSNPEDAVKAARDLLEQARDTLALFDLFFGKGSDFRNDIFDEVASACNRLQIVYYKATRDDKTCLEILKLVLPFATSTDLKEAIEKDISETSTRLKLEPVYTLLKSIEDSKEHPSTQLDKFRQTVVTAIDTAVRGLADGSNEKSQLFESAAIILRGVSLKAWNEHEDGTTAMAANLLAIKYASTPDLKRRLAEDKSTLAEMIKKKTLYGGLTPISSAPSLSTINGVGFMLYGSTNPDPANGSYLATYYFVFIGIPIFPICRYRVISDGNAYRFLGKAPLRPGDKWHLAISVGLILSPIIASISAGSKSAPANTSSYTPTSPARSSSTYTQPSAFSGGNVYTVPSSGKSALDQERASIESERAKLEALNAQIERMSAEIEQWRSYLEPNAAQLFNDKVDRYNALFQQGKAATAAFNEKVNSYNTKVRQYGH